MTGIFKANNPSGNAILFFYAIVLKLPLLLHLHAPRLQPADGILYNFFLQITDPIAQIFPYFYSLLTFILLFTQAVSFNKIVNNQRLHKLPNYLTGMSYLLITSLFSEWFSLSAPLIASSFILWIWAKLCTLYNNPDPKATIFNIGLLTGTAVFFYFPSIAFLLLVTAGIAISRPFKLQEWLIGLVGIIMPAYLFGTWSFLTDHKIDLQFPLLRFFSPHFFGNRWSYAALAIITFAIGLGLYFISKNINRQVVQTRKSWQLLFFYVIIAAVVTFFNTGFNLSNWILPALPLSAVIASAFLYPHKRVYPAILHWGMFIIYLAVGFFSK